MKLKITEAAKILSINPDTLRRLCRAGKIKCTGQTPGGHRLFSLEETRKLAKSLGVDTSSIKSKRVNIIYARVSNPDLKHQLESQLQKLIEYCTSQGLEYEIVTDFGNGLRDHRRNLNKVLRRAYRGEVERLIVISKDRILRFGHRAIEEALMNFDTRIVSLNALPVKEKQEDFARDLVDAIYDLVSLINENATPNQKKTLRIIREEIFQLWEEIDFKTKRLRVNERLNLSRARRKKKCQEDSGPENSFQISPEAAQRLRNQYAKNPPDNSQNIE